MKKFILLFGLFGAVFFSACGDSKITIYDCTGTTPTYNNDIAAIFDTYCATAGCHSNVQPEANVDLSNYLSAKNASLNGDVVGSIQHVSGYRAMPENGSQLSEANIRLISCWVQNGAPQ